jgi:PAS domain-containing protein
MGLGKLTVRAVHIVPYRQRRQDDSGTGDGALDRFGEHDKAFIDASLPTIATKLQILPAMSQPYIARADAGAGSGTPEGRESLAQNEERTRLISGAVGDGISGMDTDGNMTFANPAVPAMLGYSVEELTGKPMHDLVHYAYPDGSEFPAAKMFRCT